MSLSIIMYRLTNNEKSSPGYGHELPVLEREGTPLSHDDSPTESQFSPTPHQPWHSTHNLHTRSTDADHHEDSRFLNHRNFLDPNSHHLRGHGDDILRPPRHRRDVTFLQFIRLWLPELCSVVLSFLTLLATVVLLKVFDGRNLDDIDLPAEFTINGLIAILSTLARVFIVTPASAVLTQEVWLWFSRENAQRLRDLDLSHSASKGVWGSIVFLIYCGRRYVKLVNACMHLGVANDIRLGGLHLLLQSSRFYVLFSVCSRRILSRTRATV